MRLSGSTPAASASSRARASYRSRLRVLKELMTRPFAPSSTAQWNQAVAKKAIAELWPNGISEDLVNGQIEQRVGEQLKRMGAPGLATACSASALPRHARRRAAAGEEIAFRGAAAAQARDLVAGRADRAFGGRVPHMEAAADDHHRLVPQRAQPAADGRYPRHRRAAENRRPHRRPLHGRAPTRARWSSRRPCSMKKTQ
jgi:hypothetical protein